MDWNTKGGLLFGTSYKMEDFMIKLMIIGMIITLGLLIGFLFSLSFLGQWQRSLESSEWPNLLKRKALLSLLVCVMMGYSTVNMGSVSASDDAVAKGKVIFSKMACSSCHLIQGQGAQVGPDLSYVGDKRDRKWLLAHFKDPKSLSPNSIMPPVSLPDDDLSDLTSYMLSLKKGGK